MYVTTGSPNNAPSINPIINPNTIIFVFKLLLYFTKILNIFDLCKDNINRFVIGWHF